MDRIELTRVERAALNIMANSAASVRDNIKTLQGGKVNFLISGAVSLLIALSDGDLDEAASVILEISERQKRQREQ